MAVPSSTANGVGPGAEAEAKRAARAAKKAAKAAARPPPATTTGTTHHQQAAARAGAAGGPGYLERRMVKISDSADEARWDAEGRRRVTLLTWNILAQCLVRRELFPGSDCLKWKDRGKVLMQQVVDYHPDIACLQEVDRLEDHGPKLKEAGYDFTHVIGGYEDEGKQHGLLIAWKSTLLDKVSEKVLRFDELEVDATPSPEAPAPGQSPGRTGLSRATRNVALLCGLRWKEPAKHEAEGIVVGTQHLFWHARYVYERARQTGFLVQHARLFAASQASPGWPAFLAGDFNIQPSEAAYRLLTATPLSPSQLHALKESMLIHASVDLRNNCYRGDQAYFTKDGDEDRVFTKVRNAEPADRLLDLPELEALYQEGAGRDARGLKSLYGVWGSKMADRGEEGNFFKDRPSDSQPGAKQPNPEPKGLGDERPPAEPASANERSQEVGINEGDYEPMWTNYTPLWRCTLDYIFYLPKPRKAASSPPRVDDDLQVSALLPLHRGELLEPGLPRLGKEPSDHMALMAEAVLPLREGCERGS